MGLMLSYFPALPNLATPAIIGSMGGSMGSEGGSMRINGVTVTTIPIDFLGLNDTVKVVARNNILLAIHALIGKTLSIITSNN